MKTPATYAEWAKVLHAFADGSQDEEAMAAMQEGTLHWQSGVAERFANRFADTLNTRMNNASDLFQRKMSQASGEAELIQALLELRRSMQILVQACRIPALPKDQQDAYEKLVREQADTMQKSLEDSVKADPLGKLKSILRNHPINRLD
ncbi:hypothetical protein [Mitsuokella sp.]|uniref:hypothetical protein n=1 Tax=Mitsuokella sp. TaxID=2049034 RepID=UPI003D7DF1B9